MKTKTRRKNRKQIWIQRTKISRKKTKKKKITKGKNIRGFLGGSSRWGTEGGTKSPRRPPVGRETPIRYISALYPRGILYCLKKKIEYIFLFFVFSFFWVLPTNFHTLNPNM